MAKTQRTLVQIGVDWDGANDAEFAVLDVSNRTSSVFDLKGDMTRFIAKSQRGVGKLDPVQFLTIDRRRTRTCPIAWG